MSLIKEMLEAGVHYGHNRRFWNPYVKNYIYTNKNRIDIFDLQKTEQLFNKALEFIRSSIQNNGKILFVGTKNKASDLVKHYASSCGMPYVEKRWLGGTLTNYMSIRHSIKRLSKLEAMKESGAFELMIKKEAHQYHLEIERLTKSVGGIKNINGLPDMLFVIDSKNEKIAIQEAKCLGIPVVAVVDSDSSFKDIDYIIPGNDDSMKAIKFYLEKVSSIILEEKNKNNKDQSNKDMSVQKSDTLS